MAEIIDGKAVADEVVGEVKPPDGGAGRGRACGSRAWRWSSSARIRRARSMSRPRRSKAKECGFHSVQHTLPAETTRGGPARPHRRAQRRSRRSTASWSSCRCPTTSIPARVIQTIAPEKDVDGFHFVNVGKLGTGELETAFVPCTPAGSMLLIERVRGKDLSGLERRGRRPLQHRRQADGQSAARRQLHRHHRPQPHAGTCRRSCRTRRHPGRRRRPAGNGQGRLGEARRDRHRCRHQPHCRRRRRARARRGWSATSPSARPRRSPAPSRRCRAASAR